MLSKLHEEERKASEEERRHHRTEVYEHKLLQRERVRWEREKEALQQKLREEEALHRRAEMEREELKEQLRKEEARHHQAEIAEHGILELERAKWEVEREKLQAKLQWQEKAGNGAASPVGVEEMVLKHEALGRELEREDLHTNLLPQQKSGKLPNANEPHDDDHKLFLSYLDGIMNQIKEETPPMPLKA